MLDRALTFAAFACPLNELGYRGPDAGTELLEGVTGTCEVLGQGSQLPPISSWLAVFRIYRRSRAEWKPADFPHR